MLTVMLFLVLLLHTDPTAVLAVFGQVLPWLGPLAVSTLNLYLASKLTQLEAKILDKVFQQFEPRESCALRHEGLDAAIVRIEKALADKA